MAQEKPANDHDKTLEILKENAELMRLHANSAEYCAQAARELYERARLHK